MDKKKGFNVYYLLATEGTAEFNLFAYLTTKKFRELFEKSNVKFSDKIEIVEAGISQGKLNGVGSLHAFKAKYDQIKEKYSGQKLFFLLDKDLDDSLQIEVVIKADGDIAQFITHNTECLLLSFANKNPKNPSDFVNLKEFRDYCKSEFMKQFKKEAHDFKDPDFDSIFNNVGDEQIKASFVELFSTLS
jgi:hypothetical protein